MTNKNNLELEHSLLQHIEGQLNRADNKAQFTFTIEAILLASTTFFQTGAAMSIFDDSSSLISRIAACLFILMFISLVVSAIYSVSAVIPRLASPKEIPVNIFYFGSIVHQEEKEFIRTFNEQASSFRQMLLSEIYTTSLIAKRKFMLVRNSFIFLLIALFVWTIAQMLMLFS